MSLLSPLFAFAQGNFPIAVTVERATELAGQLVPLLMSVAIVMFFWGIVKFIANMDDENARSGGKSLMVWGMIAIFVMVSFWGIIGYFQESLGLSGGPIDTGSAPSLPDLIPWNN